MSGAFRSSYDVVVVGSGGGAMTAAALAAKAGLSVVVLERTPLIGGTSAYSGGACWLPGSEVQQRAGLPDSTEGARSYLAAVLDDPDPTRVEAFLQHAPELVAALEADELMDFEWIPFSEYYDAPGRVPMGRSIQPNIHSPRPSSTLPCRSCCGRRSSATGPVRRAGSPCPAARR